MIEATSLKVLFDALLKIIMGYGIIKKEFFKDHIEPLQQQVLAIHKDYMEGFREAEKFLRSDDKPTVNIIEFLEQRRRDYVAERDLARKLAEALADAQSRWAKDLIWPSVRDYCNCIIKYFSAASDISGISWYTDFLDGVKAKLSIGALYVWESSGISGNARRDLLEEVKLRIDVYLPRALGPVNTYYSLLRAQLL